MLPGMLLADAPERALPGPPEEARAEADPLERRGRVAEQLDLRVLERPAQDHEAVGTRERDLDRLGGGRRLLHEGPEGSVRVLMQHEARAVADDLQPVRGGLVPADHAG